MRDKLLLIYFVAILLGIATGIVGSFFQIAIHCLDAFIAQFLFYIHKIGGAVGLVSALISMVMALIAWLMVRYIAPEAGGSGVQEIEGAIGGVRPVFWRRLLPVKFIGGVLAISGQLVLGREGPTIQMGGNLGDMLADFFRLSQKRRKTLIMAGAAAGLATAFNAPLAGVLFVMEELRKDFNFTFTNFKIVAISCVMATISLHFILGAHAAIPMDIFELPSLKSLWLFFLLGIVAGFIGLLFNYSLIASLNRVDKLGKGSRVIYVIAVGAFAGFFAYSRPEIVGGGYTIIHQAITLSPGFFALTLIFLCRFFTLMFCYSTGVPGGIFAPMLALGALLGTAVYHLLTYFIEDLTVLPGMFAVAGMGALFSASIRAPITGIVLVVEMTQNYLLILPLMVSCLTSTTIMQLAPNSPIYSQLLRRVLKNEKVKKIKIVPK